MKGLRLPPPGEGRRRLVLLGVAALLVVLGLGIAFQRRVSDLRALRATGPGWAFPSRVFSDALVLTPGRVLPEAYVLAHLEARGYRQVARVDRPGTWARYPSGLEIGLRVIPDDPDPESPGAPEIVRLRLAEGHLVELRRFAMPGGDRPDTSRTPRLEPVQVSLLFDEDRVWRTWLPLDHVPAAVRDAVVAAEDRRFYAHLGFDPRGVLRALVTNVRAGQVREGGSTITQQLARALFLGRERTLVRKIIEIPVAVGLELVLTKNQILEMYLNSVYWGQARGFGVGGIAEAARWYFDTPAESLDVLQGAALAAMIPAPNLMDPDRDPRRLRERRNQVLEDMAEAGTLSEAEAAALAAHPLGIRHGPRPVERFPSYSGYVRDVLEGRLARRAATRHGLAVFTTMDLVWQRHAEVELARGLRALGGGAEGPRRRLEGALVALEPATSHVVAMVGGRSLRTGQYNRAYQARRQTGSAIKPLVYATAFESGSFTPATVVPDTPVTFGRGRSAWTPRNFGDAYHAQATLAKALEQSLNVATTHVVDMIGPGAVAQRLEEFGLGRQRPVPSIGLGSNEVSLLDLTEAYAVFAAGGMLRTPSPLRHVVDRSGHVLLQGPRSGSQALSEGVAALMTGLLQNVVRYGVAAPLAHTYGFARPAAGKTGTTNDYKDAWFVGFTPDVVAGVWVGYDRPRTIGRQAAHTALPLWARIVGGMLAGFPPAPFPSDASLQWEEIDPWTGFLADTMCVKERTPFLPGTAPDVFCTHGLEFEYGLFDSLEMADSAWIETEPAEPDTPGAEPEIWNDQPEPEPEPLPEPDPEPEPVPAPDDTTGPHGGSAARLRPQASRSIMRP